MTMIKTIALICVVFLLFAVPALAQCGGDNEPPCPGEETDWSTQDYSVISAEQLLLMTPKDIKANIVQLSENKRLGDVDNERLVTALREDIPGLSSLEGVEGGISGLQVSGRSLSFTGTVRINEIPVSGAQGVTLSPSGRVITGTAAGSQSSVAGISLQGGTQFTYGEEEGFTLTSGEATVPPDHSGKINAGDSGGKVNLPDGYALISGSVIKNPDGSYAVEAFSNLMNEAKGITVSGTQPFTFNPSGQQDCGTNCLTFSPEGSAVFSGEGIALALRGGDHGINSLDMAYVSGGQGKFTIDDNGVVLIVGPEGIDIYGGNNLPSISGGLSISIDGVLEYNIDGAGIGQMCVPLPGIGQATGFMGITGRAIASITGMANGVPASTGSPAAVCAPGATCQSGTKPAVMKDASGCGALCGNVKLLFDKEKFYLVGTAVIDENSPFIDTTRMTSLGLPTDTPTGDLLDYYGEKLVEVNIGGRILSLGVFDLNNYVLIDPATRERYDFSENSATSVTVPVVDHSTSSTGRIDQIYALDRARSAEGQVLTPTAPAAGQPTAPVQSSDNVVREVLRSLSPGLRDIYSECRGSIICMKQGGADDRDVQLLRNKGLFVKP